MTVPPSDPSTPFEQQGQTGQQPGQQGGYYAPPPPGGYGPGAGQEPGYGPGYGPGPGYAPGYGPGPGYGPYAPPPYGYPGYPRPSLGTNTMSILSLIFAFVFSPLGIVFGIIALKQLKRAPQEGRGLAIAGIVVGAVFVVLMVVYIIVIAMFIHTIEHLPDTTSTPSSWLAGTWLAGMLG